MRVEIVLEYELVGVFNHAEEGIRCHLSGHRERSGKDIIGIIVKHQDGAGPGQPPGGGRILHDIESLM